MSYQALARKWRPRQFADLVGQEHVLKALIHALDTGRLHHAYLFTGTRGVGKTTIARILAKALNCEAGVSSTPCGKCSACVDIDDGRFVDLLEVDAASRTRVEDTRELLENVQYTPTRGRYKVYLVDEVHMLSTHSFNALLKTLEEPPPHVQFLLATTDPQKLPVTVLSRCLQFNLKRLPASLIRDRLKVVAEAEDLAADGAALELLARAADGSLRDGLSLLDQAAAFGGGSLSEQSVASMLGTVDREHAVRLVQAVADDDGPRVLDEIAALDERVPDYSAVLESVAALIQRAAVLQAAPDLDTDEDGLTERARPLANAVSPEDLQLWYQIALAGRRDLPLAPSPRAGCEMALLRMLAFRLASAQDKPAAQPPAGPARGAPAARRSKTAATAGDKPPPAAGPARKPAKSSPEPADKSGDETAAMPLDDWEALIDRLGLTGATRQLARHCELAGRDGTAFRLVIDPEAEYLATRVQQDRLRDSLREGLGDKVRLQIEVARPKAETPAARAARQEQQRRAEAARAIDEDPLVRDMQKVFDATVDLDSVRPVGDSQEERSE
ncbi:MAG: DNA polymerase III subunit gamma/tau [Gammaproteobacteria bacterium]